MQAKNRPAINKNQPKTAFELAMDRALAEKEAKAASKNPPSSEKSKPISPESPDSTPSALDQPSSEFSQPAHSEVTQSAEHPNQDLSQSEQLPKVHHELGQTTVVAESLDEVQSTQDLGQVAKRSADAKHDSTPAPARRENRSHTGDTDAQRNSALVRHVDGRYGSAPIRPESHARLSRNQFLEVSIYDFDGIRPPEEIVDDLYYTERRNQEFEKLGAEKIHEHRVAKKFESVVLQKFYSGHWLGESNRNPDFHLAIAYATQYDDYTRRIDAFATLVPNQQLSPDTSSTEPQSKIILPHDLILGFDATTGGRKTKIIDKLTCSYTTDRTYTDFGYSEVKYYKDPNGTPVANPVPALRYVIGVSNQDALNLILKKAPQSDGYTSELAQNHLANSYLAWTRFKVLTEIQAQNQFYQAMLPDPPSSSDADPSAPARIELAYMAQTARNAISRSTLEIVYKGYYRDLFPPQNQRDQLQHQHFKELYQLQHQLWSLLDNAEKNREISAKELEWGKAQRAQGVTAGTLFNDNWQHAQEIIENHLRTTAKAKFTQSHPNAPSSTTDAFVQIVDCARELTKDAEAGLLDQWKGSGRHNKILLKRGQDYIARSPN